jgi:hypothetical protein
MIRKIRLIIFFTDSLVIMTGLGFLFRAKNRPFSELSENELTPMIRGKYSTN